MSIFKKKPVFKSYSFPNSKSFRGFKRFPVVSHGHAPSMENCVYFSDKDLSKSTIVFQEATAPDYGKLFVQVLIDGKQIGAIFDAQQITEIQTGAFTDVHIHFEKQTVVSTEGEEQRDKACLFVKYK